MTRKTYKTTINILSHDRNVIASSIEDNQSRIDGMTKTLADLNKKQKINKSKLALIDLAINSLNRFDDVIVDEVVPDSNQTIDYSIIPDVFQPPAEMLGDTQKHVDAWAGVLSP